MKTFLLALMMEADPPKVKEKPVVQPQTVNQSTVLYYSYNHATRVYTPIWNNTCINGKCR